MRSWRSGKKEKQPPSLSKTVITRYILNAAIAVYLVLFIGISISTFLSIQGILSAQSIQISTVADQIELYLQEIDQTMQVMADATHYIKAEQLTGFLNSAREYNPRFTSIFVVDSQGIVTVESSNSPMLLGLDLSGETFFENFQPEQTYYSEPFVSLLEENVVVTTATPINGMADGQITGLLVAELNLSRLQQVVNDVSIDEGLTFIIDSKGTYIAHPNSTLVQERQYFPNKELLEKANFPENSFEIFKDAYSGEWQIGSIALIHQSWYVVTQQPLPTVFFPIFLIILTATIAFVLTIWLFFSQVQRSLKRIATPVANLAEKAEQISQGNYDLQFEQTGESFEEIDSLERSFSRMLAGIQNRDRYLEQRVEQRTRQLQEANKDLEAFMYSISHDLRAPLRAVVGYSEILSSEHTDSLDEGAKAYLERILAQGKRMDQLITDLLDLSRLGRQSLKIENLDLSDLVQAVFEREIEKFGHDNAASLVLHPTPTVKADPQLIEIMLTNLIDNAIKFSAPSSHPLIEFGFQENDDGWHFYLRDNGVGFDNQYADKLFIPFQRLHASEKFEGTGIGLAIVQRVIRIHEGRIWVDSAPGAGTTFYFSL